MSKTIHFLVNVYRDDAVAAAKKAAEWLQGQGCDLGADPESAPKLNLLARPSSDFGKCDLCLAFGGDGTVINAAHLCASTSAPILGIYFGRFGFVTQCVSANLQETLANFLQGKSEVESRMMLHTELRRQGSCVAELLALNEVVVQRSVGVRMLTLNVQVDGVSLTTYPADGVMVATPTGSTGYNLSAGGPIIDPRVEALVLSAIAPHTLSARSLVLGPNSEAVISLEGIGDAMLSADNKSHLHVLPGDQLIVRKSEFVTRLLRARDNDFLFKLANRLFWSQHVMGESL